MFCTKNLATNFSEVPKEWIWSYYCNIWDVDFDGSTITVNSIFNKEKTPSMKLYFKNEKYKFKDFSSGYGGDEIDLVKYILDFHHDKKVNCFQATLKILTEYNNWLLNNDNKCDLRISDFKKQKSYKVEFKTRGWNELDRKFWTSFYIGSKTLNKYNVAALSEFTLINDEDQFTVVGEYIYGYFNNQGELVKIYQPKVAHRKFVYVRQYLQGENQLEGHDYLIIQSGLKDIMSSYSMRLKIDYVAPDSENVMISPVYMKRFIKEYKQVLIMLDNDNAGHKATQKYLNMYPEVKAIYHCFKDCKDTAEIISKTGVNGGRRYFVPLIHKSLNDYNQIFINKKQLILYE